jgi:hypothetical protein
MIRGCMYIGLIGWREKTKISDKLELDLAVGAQDKEGLESKKRICTCVEIMTIFKSCF